MAKPDMLRAKFYGILDASLVKREQWLEKCQALIAGGAGVIQLRAKGETLSARILLLESILPTCEEARVPLIINDDLELCLKYPGLGLHVGQEDIPAVEARAHLGPDRFLGLSTHSLDQAKEALALVEVLNYFAVGPIFSTATKPDYTAVGLELIRDVVALEPELPFFVIGGINRTTVGKVCEAGARQVVVVSDVLCDDDTCKAVKGVCEVLQSYD